MPSNPSKDYYFIHRNTGRTEPVLIEYGFVDNAKDANFIKNNWQDLGEAVVRAVLTYIGAPYDMVGENSIYVVQRGDSLYSIAKKFNVSIDNLKATNNLQNNLITIGQKLVIPGFTDTTGSNINYVVQRGDTLYSIASKYNTTVNEIKKLNKLTSNLLSIGQNIKIPYKEIAEVEIDENMPINTYVVKLGDTISTIADDYNISVTDLINYNNLTDYELYVGQILKIPTIKEETNNTYIVQRGDTLYSIARQFNTTVDAIKKLNNLDGNNLQVGQSLIIVDIPNSIDNTYIVQKGDTLYSIARELNTTVNELRKLNNLTSNVLSINQVLRY